VAQAVACLPSKLKSLSSNPTIALKKCQIEYSCKFTYTLNKAKTSKNIFRSVSILMILNNKIYGKKDDIKKIKQVGLGCCSGQHAQGCWVSISCPYPQFFFVFK
jgi:hypothetical protein